MTSKMFGSQKAVLSHLVKPGPGLPGEIYDLRKDIEAAFTLLENGGLYITDEFTNPAVADTDFVKTSFSGSTSAVILRAADLTNATLPMARQITITRSNTANAFSTDPITIVGKAYGVRRTLTFTPASDDGNDTLVPDEDDGLDEIYEVRLPANALGTGTYMIGFGAPLCLRGKPRVRAGLVNVLKEIMDGAAAATPGTFAGRLYTPDTAVNGVHDYSVTYEVDPAG